MMSSRAEESEAWLRRVLRGTAAMIFAVTIAELVLQEHTEGGIQTLPFVACGLGLAAILTLAFVSDGVGRLLGRSLLGLVAASGALGVYEHIETNYEFTREIKPQLVAGQAFLEALFGASPILAPGILVLAAFLGLASTMRRGEVG